MNLGSQRDLFEIPEDIVYLNCAYMSPQLRPAREIGERAVSRKSRPWEITPDDFFEDAEEARALFARLVGGDADGVAIVPSVSYGISVAAANVPVREGQKIIILEDQFPSNVYAWRELAERSGARLVTVPRPEDLDWTPCPARGDRRRHRRRGRPELPLDRRIARRPRTRRREGPRSRSGARRRRDTVAWGVSFRRLGGSAGLPGRLLVQVAARAIRCRVHVRRGGVSGGEAHRAQLDQPPRKPGLLAAGGLTRTPSSLAPDATTWGSGATSPCSLWRPRRCASSSTGESRTSPRPSAR